MTIRAAKIENSPRLLRFLGALASGEWRSTLEIIQTAQVMAISSCAAECRAQGVAVECERHGRIWRYRLPGVVKRQQELSF